MGGADVGARRAGRRATFDGRCSGRRLLDAARAAADRGEPARRAARPHGPRQCELTQAAGARRARTMQSWLRGHRRLSRAAAGPAGAQRAGAGAAAGARGRRSPTGAVTAEAVAVDRPGRRGREPCRGGARAGRRPRRGRRRARRRSPPTRPHRRAAPGGAATTWPGWTPTAPSPTPPSERSLTVAGDTDGTVVRPRPASTPSAGRSSRPRSSRSCRPTAPPATCAPAPSSRPTRCAAGRQRPRRRDLPILRRDKPHVVVTIDLEDLDDPHHRCRRRPHRVRRRSSPRPRPAGWPATATSPASSSAPKASRWTRPHQRLFPPHLRRAVEVRDRHCVFAGCDAPTHWCDVHHLHPLDRRRRDRRWRTQRSLCERHHTKVHHGFRVDGIPTDDGAPGAPTAPRSLSTPMPADWPELIAPGPRLSACVMGTPPRRTPAAQPRRRRECLPLAASPWLGRYRVARAAHRRRPPARPRPPDPHARRADGQRHLPRRAARAHPDAGLRGHARPRRRRGADPDAGHRRRRATGWPRRR